MRAVGHSFTPRILAWSIAIGFVGVLLALKGTTQFTAAELKEIVVFFLGGAALGCLVGFLFTAYNEKRRTLFHIWGWGALGALLGLLFNTGTPWGYGCGAMVGAALGVLLGWVAYAKVARVAHPNTL